VKLATFIAPGDSAPRLGAVLGDAVVPFDALGQREGKAHAVLGDMLAYLQALPASEKLARELLAGAMERAGESGKPAARPDVESFPVADVRFLPAVPRPPALIDFGLTPRHLKNSAATMLRHEYGRLAGAVASLVVRRRIERMAASPVLLYYKGNHNEIIGDNDEAGWPAYTSYLDIEPELAVVAGTGARPIAGYLIFNDLSARDVQMPEMMGTGPARSKDFARGNGLGPLLATPDEVPDPRALRVQVRVGDRFTWRGHTSEYTHTPEQAVAFLHTVFTPPPGTVIGLGTVPGCTGMDNDQWLYPGDRVEITFDALGTLRQPIPTRLPRLERSRWKNRPELAEFYAS
jgi:2-keto-4-pentenoate hydratase/2-oxohepta-3-ene-1,7-dioic acid hydratase in catechol pathway